ncbi:MAG: sensor histidine kinase [Candidatus Izimaplasma sp.]|nr:sensor histidine kinase [Candidatus Izimaplasma bacterium]
MFKLFKNSSISQSILIPTILIVILSLLTVSLTTFFSYQMTTSEIAEDSSKEINKQIILNFDNYIESVINTANYIQQKTIEHGLKNDNAALSDIYNQAAEVQPDIESIVLIDTAGNMIISSSYKDVSIEDLTTKSWFLDAISNESIYHFSSPHQQDIFIDSTAEVITVTKMADYYIGGNKFSGIIVVDINFSNIITLASTTNLGDGGHLIILDEHDSLIYSNGDSCVPNNCITLEIAKDIIFGGESVEVDGISMYANVNNLTATRWRLATFVNTEIINQTRNSNLLIMGIIFISTMIVTMAASSYISNRISSPINILKDHMQQIEKGDFYQKIEIHGQKEVVVLTHSFNSMIEEIKTLMNKVVQEQREKRKTEFQALQSQINPHFLYNTLDSIVYLSENKMNEKVIEMVIALSKFFRISISRGKNIILLREEIEHAKNYLLIQKIRYNEKFDYEFIVDEEVMDYKVVKLSLQPLIENAIYHGINTEYDQGKILIRAFKKDNKLMLEVEDDGYGIPDEKIEELYQNIKYKQNGTSIGLRNVFQRLKLYYGDNADLIIESELDEKTIVRLEIPLERAK